MIYDIPLSEQNTINKIKIKSKQSFLLFIIHFCFYLVPVFNELNCFSVIMLTLST